MTTISLELESKKVRLIALLREYDRVAVAYSGGVDSAVVAYAANLACGEKAVAVTAVSDSLAQGELEDARNLATIIGIRHLIIQTQEFDNAEYTANSPQRCFHCKSELYSRLEELLPQLDLDVCVIVNGANLDDDGDWRPGLRAAKNFDVKSPLKDVGLTKDDVRALARHWGLPVWDKPASPCLSSRVAYGVEVTPERVKRIDDAERFLRDELLLRELRVRCEANELARIEVPLTALPRLLEESTRDAIVTKFRELGFRYITLDLEGFRSGSLNLVHLAIGELSQE
ncbi:MAG: ATP-dependent sacrificial sulfur transferase LarE [Planctomycetota bacterium]|nr:ATP-dependent sacrificial sulfur transferase LarE [Planctomycetota bacterium]MDA1213276.1 ATP-dependent sacrificial sulfur transferase LarE [Planctomycetota bacterium]